MTDDRQKLVPFSRVRRTLDPARLADFAATAQRLQREREESEDPIARALSETPRAGWRGLADREDLRSGGVLERLAQEVERKLDGAPHDALLIAELSAAIAEALPSDAYPPVMMAQLRAHAWKDVGLSLCHLSRYAEALAALDRAAAWLEPVGILGHDEAIVRFVRATTLQHVRRFDEAEEMLNACTEVFRTHGDTMLLDKCAVSRGILLVRRGDYRAARELLRPLQGRTASFSDASVSLALGWCGIHLADAADALRQFTRAGKAFEAIGCELQAVHASAGIGTALLRLGHLDRAIRQLTAARGRFLAERFIEQAGLTGLQMVEAYLHRGDAINAKLLAAQIVREFTDAGLSRRAIEALAYLEEAVSASTVSTDIVRSVHDYIVTLRNDPSATFAALN
jgi:tetratricopeptide (TPR) repeat protein